ncbi:hypothetical protein [Infirmifilum sp. NZ]|uniref:hypothetical protein n=1 Tax=Infirmifilum sp. NZ TaxID=2926850 RepID=UPI0027A56E86|nr:hypothetical protein [Infirmifilum sp. NZ]UNQ73341.1 hypothetical protein MOV14_09545 [Infirmifilum sp. NZ]
MTREMVELAALAEKLRGYLELVFAANLFFSIGLMLGGYWLVTFSLFVIFELGASLHAWLAAVVANFALAALAAWLLSRVSPGAVRRAWALGGLRSLLALAPFVVLYALPYPTPYVYAVLWVPALGIYHLILYAFARGARHSKLFLLSALLILLGSPAPLCIALQQAQGSADSLAFLFTPILGLGIVLLSYFVSALYGLWLAKGCLESGE